MRYNHGFTKFISSLLVILMVWGCANSNLNTPNLFTPENNNKFNTKNYPCNNTYVNASAMYNSTFSFQPSSNGYQRPGGQTNSSYIFSLNLTGNEARTEISYTLGISHGSGNWFQNTTTYGTINKSTLSAGDSFTIDISPTGNSGVLTFTMTENTVEVTGTFNMWYEYDPYIVTFNNATASIPLDKSCTIPTPTPTPTATATPVPTPTPVPTIPPTTPPDEELSQEEIQELAKLVFPDCKSFSIQSPDLGKGPTCPPGGKGKGSLFSISGIIDFAGRIIEAAADDELQAAIDASTDAKQKGQLARVQKKVKEIRENLTEIQKIRKELNVGEGKNIGTLKGTLGTENVDQIGISGKNTKIKHNNPQSEYSKKLVDVDHIPEDQRILGAKKGWGDDSEAKLLENTAQKLKENPSLNGNLKLFSERPPCEKSCEGVIKEFQDKYKGRVTLDVLHGPKKTK